MGPDLRRPREPKTPRRVTMFCSVPSLVHPRSAAAGPAIRMKSRRRGDAERAACAERPERPDRRADVRARGENQAELLRFLRDDETPIVVCSGPAGCGKTHLAVSVAVERLARGDFDRIVMARPAVGAFEDHGFLPGGIDEKMEPWVRPMIDVAESAASPSLVRTLRDQGRIEAAPLAYMRGRTFKRTFAILDESQDALPEQVLMFLSRIGEGSKFVVAGDPAQSDRGRARNGLEDLWERLERVVPRGFAAVRFARGDVQRHPVLSEVLRVYALDSGSDR